MNYKWGIFIADLNPVQGSEQKGTRPVIVVSDEDFNRLMPVVTILPVTSLKEGRRVYPNEVLLKQGMGGLAQDSIILAHQIRTISKNRLRDSIGFINNNSTHDAINDALRVHLNL
ncbi:MAG: type II toxin-antitoxin system PemK/MazF family toxin [Thermodesulfovibrionia bacterium]|nr:type II toxin-antitoxin system PemK/MazF family toxin [Thermodesulfovibrionia bacterium]